MKTSLTLLFVCLYSVLTAQMTNETRDYILDINGNKISGTLIDKGWNKNPTTIEFKKGGSNETVSYSAKDIQAFYVAKNNRYFSSEIVDFNTSSHVISDLSLEKKPVLKEQTLFLELLFSGDQFDLFQYVDFQLRDHFFIKDKSDGSITELIQHKYRTDAVVNGRTVNGAKTVNTYQGQINYYFNDCQEAGKSIQYKKKALVAVFKEYHECKEAPYVSYFEKAATPIRLSLFGGVAISKYNFNGVETILSHRALMEKSTGVQFSPSAGFIFDYSLRGKNNLASIFFGMDYFSREINFNHTISQNTVLGDRIHEFELITSSYYLNFNFGFGLNFLNDKKISPFLKFGIRSNTMIAYKSNYLQSRNLENSPNPPTITRPAFFNDDIEMIRKSAITPLIIVGVNFYDFFISYSLSYNFGGHIELFTINDSQLNTSLDVGYRFTLNKKKLKQ